MAAKYPGSSKNEGGDQRNIQHVSGLPVDYEFISECDVVFEDGNDLAKLHSSCTKHPGHPNFIPVSELKPHDLPKNLQTRENLDFIKKKIDLTVRVRVSCTSLRRPDVFSDNKAPYPFANFKGSKRAVRYGTGIINRFLSRQPIKGRPCPCHLCVASGNPKKEYSLITVSTSTHVIYDDSEAELATFDCFFDSDDSKNVKKLYGLCVDGINTSNQDMYKSDVCEVVCVTHDSQTMKQILSVVHPSTLSMPHFFSSSFPPEGVIVSHPHGCSKMITFGKVKYLTVPIKPVYKTGTPISLQCDTQCRLNLNRVPSGQYNPHNMPASELSMKHLPVGLQTQENLEMIKRKIDQTVRICVPYTSPNRPDMFSDNEATRHFSKYEDNKTVMRYGTGTINRFLSRQPIKDHPCPCHLCVASGNPKKEYSLITVSTSTHVIFDDSEAELATFDCFFDSDDSKNVKKLYGLHLTWTNTSQQDNNIMHTSDVYEVVCATHDSDTINKIVSVVYPLTLNSPVVNPSALPPEGIMVSHSPRGCKKITFGTLSHPIVSIQHTDKACPPFIPPGDGKPIIENRNISTKSAPESFDQERHIPYYLKNHKRKTIIENEKCLSDHEGFDDPFYSTSSEFAATKKSLATPRCPLNGTRQVAQETEERREAYSKRVSDALSKLIDSCAKHCKYPSGFSYSSMDQRARLQVFKAIFQDKGHSQNHFIFKLINASLTSLSGITQTSKQCSGKEIQIGEIDSSVKQEVCDLLSDNLEKFDLSEETMLSMCSLLERPLSKAFDQTHPNNIQQVIAELYDSSTILKYFEDVDFDYLSDDSSSDDELDFSQNMTQLLDAPSKNLMESTGITDFLKYIIENRLDVSPRHKPFRLNAILPQKAEFAMRYYSDSPGWFSFPPETKIITSEGQTTALKEGIEFRSPSFHPQYAFISYDIDTCGGSSGAAVYSNLLGNQGMTYFPHTGSANGCNRSAIYENRMYPLFSTMFSKIETWCYDDIPLD